MALASLSEVMLSTLAPLHTLEKKSCFLMTLYCWKNHQNGCQMHDICNVKSSLEQCTTYTTIPGVAKALAIVFLSFDYRGIHFKQSISNTLPTFLL